jgi:hypothetical protein
MQHRRSFLLAGGDPAIRADDPEPPLHDLLDDPVLKLLLKGDRVRSGDLLNAIERARARLGVRFAPAAAEASSARTDCTV